ncbi:MAG: hypothetical protein IPK07_27295 [Deltaproteobacteria bacterium]|nr:hypothetical protein [Deltaproteobacteria bacterium]
MRTIATSAEVVRPPLPPRRARRRKPVALAGLGLESLPFPVTRPDVGAPPRPPKWPEFTAKISRLLEGRRLLRLVAPRDPRAWRPALVEGLPDFTRLYWRTTRAPSSRAAR